MTSPTLNRTKYAREWARQRRADELAIRNASATTCQARMGLHGVCGGMLETFTDGQGSTRTTCPLCARKARGVCRDCGQPVEGQIRRAIRCAHHKAVEAIAASERYRLRHPEQHRRTSRRVYQRSKAKRTARNDYKRLWRKANRDKVKQQKRRSNLRGVGRKNAADLRARRLVRGRVLHATPATQPRSTPRLCLSRDCEIVVTGRTKLCTKCRENQRQNAVRLLEQRRAAA